MNPLNEQIITLTDKVDALHQLISQLSAQVSSIASSPAPGERGSHLEMIGLSGESLYGGEGGGGEGGEGLPRQQVHKDVLVDSTIVSLGRSGNDQPLSSEVQIQRLTAQLTAAYNRIAALEEQLLANRVHS